jgi:protein-tyrosine phosphatase
VRFAVLLATVGVAQVAAGISLGWIGALLVWSGAACLVVAAGYAGVGARVIGKRPDGSLPALRVIALLPYLLGTWIVWFFARRRGSECGQRIVDGLWLGRRPLRGELPDEIVAVVDLTSEFPRSPDVGTRAYCCHPLLDATAPDVDALTRLVDWIDAQPGPVYVHCAAGHGRSAAVVAAALIARGRARDAASAMAVVRAARRRARLNGPQSRSLDAFARTLREARG